MNTSIERILIYIGCAPLNTLKMVKDYDLLILESVLKFLILLSSSKTGYRNNWQSCLGKWVRIAILELPLAWISSLHFVSLSLSLLYLGT